MGYQALKKMQKKNKENYGISGVPHIPKAHTQNRDAEGKWKDIGNLEKKVQEFIRDACEDLNFKTDDKHSMLFDLDGKSLEKNQIPYNMEMDLNRLCLENAIHRFVETGITQDAFDVYFCYLEMFIGEYQKSKRMVEMLGEFESNAGSLLLKHRDHYTHSVYVFLIGLALYQSNEDYKIQYQKFYRLGDEKTAAHHFLKFWGLSALFHDIGYPFEIPFEQVKSYFVGEDKKPFIVYRNMKDYVNLEKGASCIIQI